MAIVLEVIDLAQYEGKTTYDSFERGLVQQLMDTINKKTLPLGTELLIAVFLSRVDNFKNNYQQKVAKKLTKKLVAFLFHEFEASSRLNQRLIQMCVDKKIFGDDNEYYVKMQLMIYGTKLHEIQSAESKSKSKSVEKVIDYKFTSEEITSKSIRKRMSSDQTLSVPAKKLRR